MTAPTFTEQLAGHIRRTRYEDLPPEVVHKCKEQILYHFGLAFGGQLRDFSRQLRAVLPVAAAGPVNAPLAARPATVIGQRDRLALLDATFANSTLLRATMRDDVMFPGGLHPALVTLPIALGLGEVLHRSGRDVILSLVVAYEAMAKVANVRNGWAAPLPRRPTQIYGGFGPVTVAGKLLDFSPDQLTHALGFGAQFCMGVPEGGQMNHYYSFIARNGLLGALFAQAGGLASSTVLEGQHGLYESYFGELPARELQASLDAFGTGEWEITGATQKRYHGTGANIIAVEQMRTLMREERLTHADVSSLHVFLSSKKRQRTEVVKRGPFTRWGESHSSMPYELAILLLDGEVTMERHGLDRINAPDSYAMMQRIEVFFEDGHESPRYARIEVRTADGRRFVRAADTHGFGLAESEWTSWLATDGARLLEPDQLAELERLIRDLENVGDVARLMACVVPRRDITYDYAPPTGQRA